MSTPPFKALFWMLLNEVEMSAERVTGLKPADAVAELDDVAAVLAWLNAAGMPAELLTQIDGARLHPDEEQPIRDAARPRYLAAFRGQAWIMGNALDVDDSRFEFEVSQAEIDAAGGFSEDSIPEEDDFAPAGNDWDALAQAAGAPADVKNWPGPFEITVLRKL